MVRGLHYADPGRVRPRGRGQWLGGRPCGGASRRKVRRSSGHAHEFGDQTGTWRGNRPFHLSQIASLWGEDAMKFAATVSLAALALASCATNPELAAAPADTANP